MKYKLTESKSQTIDLSRLVIKCIFLAGLEISQEIYDQLTEQEKAFFTKSN